VANNLIPIIVDHLGVNIDEEFWLKEIDGNVDKEEVYKFTDNFLVCQNTNSKWFVDEMAFARLIAGELEIVKPPYEPKMNETYYTYTDDWTAINLQWTGNAWDYINKECEMVFRTEKELIAMRPKQYYKLTGKKWEDPK
jgi:hypothetical protein